MPNHAELIDKLEKATGEMIEVPLTAFALLMAYSHTSSPDVPSWIKAHPEYPAHHEHRVGHLRRALAPYAKQAFRAIQHQGGTDGLR